MECEESKMFVSQYGERQISLRQTAMLPAYWRKRCSHDAVQVRHEKAKKVSVAAPMFAGPMGKVPPLKYALTPSTMSLMLRYSTGTMKLMDSNKGEWEEKALQLI